MPRLAYERSTDSNILLRSPPWTRSLRVLASAPSNIAVDNMLEKMLDAGLKAVRMGHPARILESYGVKLYQPVDQVGQR